VPALSGQRRAAAENDHDVDVCVHGFRPTERLPEASISRGRRGANADDDDGPGGRPLVSLTLTSTPGDKHHLPLEMAPLGSRLQHNRSSEYNYDVRIINRSFIMLTCKKEFHRTRTASGG